MEPVNTPLTTFDSVLGSLADTVRWSYRHHSFQGSSPQSQSRLPDCRCVECRPNYKQVDRLEHVLTWHGTYEQRPRDILDNNVSSIRSTLRDSDGSSSPKDDRDTQDRSRKSFSYERYALTPLTDNFRHSGTNISTNSSQIFENSYAPSHSFHGFKGPYLPLPPSQRYSTTIPRNPDSEVFVEESSSTVAKHSTCPLNQSIPGKENRNKPNNLPMEGVLPPALDRKRKRAQAFASEENEVVLKEFDACSGQESMVHWQPVQAEIVQTHESPKPRKKARVGTKAQPPPRERSEPRSATTSKGPSKLPIVNVSIAKAKKAQASVKVRPQKKQKTVCHTQSKAKGGSKRKRNGKKNVMDANKRRKEMEDDPCSAKVEPNRAWCVFCNNWKQTDSRRNYYNSLWKKHTTKTMLHQKAVNNAMEHWNVEELSISIQQALLDMEIKKEEERLKKEEQLKMKKEERTRMVQ